MDKSYITFSNEPSEFQYTSTIIEVRNIEHYWDHDKYSCVYYGMRPEYFKTYRNAHVRFTGKDEYIPCKIEYRKYDSFRDAHLIYIIVANDNKEKGGSPMEVTGYIGCYETGNIEAVKVFGKIVGNNYIRLECTYYGNPEVFAIDGCTYYFTPNDRDRISCNVVIPNDKPFIRVVGRKIYVDIPLEKKNMEYKRTMCEPAPKCSCVIGSSKSLDIDRILVDGPATIVWWNDGSKTVVKRNGDDQCNWYAAVAYALAKKHFGTNSVFKKKVMKKIDFANAYVHNKEDSTHE